MLSFTIYFIAVQTSEVKPERPIVSGNEFVPHFENNIYFSDFPILW